MKKKLLFLTAAVFLLSSGVSVSASETDFSVRDAVPQGWLDQPEEAADFPALFSLCEAVIREVGGEDALQEWMKNVNPEMEMNRTARRDDGIILATLTAEAIGYNYYNATAADNRPVQCSILWSSDYDWVGTLNEFSGDYPYIYNADREIPLYQSDGTKDESIGNGVPPASASFLNQRMDLENEVCLLDYDENDDFCLAEDLTREAAVTCLERLLASANVPEAYTSPYYTQNWKFQEEHDRDYETSENADVQKILDDAAQWEADFLAEQPELSYTGQAYYVSNSGDDSADGKTPETAWATIDRAISQQMEPGDCILLERGGKWRIEDTGHPDIISDTITIPQGISMGAYGEGPRPQISGEAPDGSLPESWELYLEEDGARIWKFHRDQRFAPFLVLNGGEEWADAVLPWVSEADASYIHRDGSPFDVGEALSKDLTFCVLLDMNLDTLPKDNNELDACALRGDLYFRCDAGNPAEVYDEVAIPQVPCGIAVQEGGTVCGISLKYFSCTGAGLADYDTQSIEGHKAFNSSEVSWCGGNLSYYGGEGYLFPMTAGGALQTSSGDISLEGNYIHDCGPMTFIVAMHVDNDQLPLTTFKDLQFRDNLVVRCEAALSLMDFTGGDLEGCRGFFSDVVFEDNQVLYSGMGWYSGQHMQINYGGYTMQTAIKCNGIDNDGIYIRNNILCFSEGNLFTYTGTNSFTGEPTEKPVLSGNTYVHNGENSFATFHWGADQVDADTFLAEMNDDSRVILVPSGRLPFMF